MKLDGRRMSDNVSDRRGERMNMAGGGMGLLRLLAILPGGIKTKLVGLAVVAAVVLATQGTSGLSGLLGVQSPQTEQTQYQGTPEEQELYKFSAQILAGTEEMKFSSSPYTIDKDYEMRLRERMGLFVSQTRTRCGIHITLVTTFGVVRNSHYHSIVNSEVCLDDLFA